jgi:hypothetical protein
VPALKDHLIGAYGLFWDRHGVIWNPGSGDTWQLLGYRNQNYPAARVCDFRTAKGVYILYDDHGATYSGIARGIGGLGARLRTHNTKPPRRREWTRFSWFSLDDIVETPEFYGWERVTHRTKPVPTQSEAAIREIEALLIKVLGTQQNKMQFLNANQWE